ncbi:prolyl oligopeptidase family-domain-containing protein [Syncephalis plumigaleata]|nr:prolyl oligopeptidase family-domain-containing protein [Syncephalis plumigaleata]
MRIVNIGPLLVLSAIDRTFLYRALNGAAKLGKFSSLTLPLFNAFWYIFIKHFRGIVALAAVRGGGEYGDVWHKSGILHNKQNSITDFQNAARYLISKKYTLPQLITAEGASNGGLLVAAAINQTPELFGCGLPSVGVMDMLRFHKFTAGRFWKPEYGDPEKKEYFMYLRTYSPLHNIPKTNRYPAMLLMTSDGDDRVVPSHSYKMAAQLQQTLPNNPNPLMLLVNTKSGHGGQSTSQQIDKMVDKCSFMAMSLGLQWHP